LPQSLYQRREIERRHRFVIAENAHQSAYRAPYLEVKGGQRVKIVPKDKLFEAKK